MPDNLTYTLNEIERLLRSLQLDNLRSFDSCIESEDEMNKIDRRVCVNGKLVRIRAKDEQDYADKLIDIFSRSASSPVSSPRSVKTHSFKDYALAWFKTFAEPNIERSTAITYKRQLDLHWIPAFGSMPLEDITAQCVQQVFNSMADTAKETKQKAKIVLNMIFEQALDDEIISKNPLKSKSIKLTGRAAKETKAYTVEQMRYIVSHLQDIAKPTDRAYLALQALHPLRLEEVLGLKYEDIDAEERVIHIRRSVTHPDRNRPEVKDTKTEQSKRDIALVSQVLQFIPPNQPPTDYIIGGKEPVSYQTVKRMCERIKKDINFDGNITPRRFRSTVLTDIYDTTKDIKQAQAAAGHTTAAMTLKHYVKGRELTKDTASPVAIRYGLQ